VKVHVLRISAALLAAAGGWVTPAGAVSGRVVDPEGKPVVAARACLMVGQSWSAEGLCDETRAEGSYRLPTPRVPSLVRIVADGFLPSTVTADERAEPVVLRRAASLLVRVLDAKTGQPIPKSEVHLVYPDGEDKGPLPANRAGVLVKALPPGEALVSAKAAGYAERKGDTITLEAGRKTEVELKLEPE